MSTALQPKPRIIGQKIRICIVAAKYNEKFTDSLVENAIEELGEIIPMAHIDLIRVPGAFEIPIVVSSILARAQTRCVIALGLLIKGDTGHADIVATSVTNALQDLSLKHKVPVIHGVLLVNDEKQAYTRCIAASQNRGRECARAAAGIIDVITEIEKSLPKQEKKRKPI